MKAFFNDQKNKDTYLDQLRVHVKNGDLIKGEYWDGKKGSAVGCTVESFDCAKFETLLAVPKEVAYIEDALFDELHEEDAQLLPEKILRSINIGANLSSIYAHLIAWQFEDPYFGLKNIRSVRNDPELMSFCQEAIGLYKKESGGENVDPKEFEVLYLKISKAWAIIGEKKRIERMNFARRWKLFGARKWAWISLKSWSSTWAWVQAITRPRNRSQTLSVVLHWSNAWKWVRFHKNRQSFIVSIENRFLELIKQQVQ